MNSSENEKIKKMQIQSTTSSYLTKELFQFLCQQDNDKKTIDLNIKEISKQFKNRNDLINLNKTASSLFKDAQEFCLLTTGQYYFNKGNHHLVLNQHGHTFLLFNKDQYQGYKNINNKTLFYGHFTLGPQTSQQKLAAFIYQGQGQMFEFPTSPAEKNKKYFYYSGKWLNNEIVSGTKQTFSVLGSQNQRKQRISQNYEGQFQNMKYHGKGTLQQGSLQDPRNMIVKKGKFNFGIYEGNIP